jgi:hypothetical protein
MSLQPPPTRSDAPSNHPRVSPTTYRLNSATELLRAVTVVCFAFAAVIALEYFHLQRSISKGCYLLAATVLLSQLKSLFVGVRGILIGRPYNDFETALQHKPWLLRQTITVFVDFSLVAIFLGILFGLVRAGVRVFGG